MRNENERINNVVAMHVVSRLIEIALDNDDPITELVRSREFAAHMFRQVTGLDIDNDDPQDIARLIARESDMIIGQYSDDGVAVQARLVPTNLFNSTYDVEVDVLYTNEDGAHETLRTFYLDLEADLDDLDDLGFRNFVESVRERDERDEIADAAEIDD
ncbi:MAG: hypothetical protein AB7D39_12780 [Pseudodesulfovibrio sp.]|uniref:hypothetical protein n=1 Tax=Pseudodesulfovibrio sp. TaxID=2035812 RepID=UPI003D11E6F8